MREKEGLSKVIDAIDHGASLVEEIHQSIAELPLKLIEQSEALYAPARKVELLQYRAIGAIYDTVRGVNLTIEFVARRLLNNRAHGPAKRSRARSKVVVSRASA